MSFFTFSCHYLVDSHCFKDTWVDQFWDNDSVPLQRLRGQIAQIGTQSAGFPTPQSLGSRGSRASRAYVSGTIHVLWAVASLRSSWFLSCHLPVRFLKRQGSCVAGSGLVCPISLTPTAPPAQPPSARLLLLYTNCLLFLAWLPSPGDATPFVLGSSERDCRGQVWEKARALCTGSCGDSCAPGEHCLDHGGAVLAAAVPV